ncbi:MAG: tRNA 4-thiouridine(8) synthase ThiI [Anaerolineae bacterium]
MGLLLLRYGEIGLKGQNRTYFMRKLRRNVRKCLKANGIDGEVWQEGQRIYLRTPQPQAALEAVSRVFGLVSLSPVEVVPADNGHPSPEAIARTAVDVARRAGVGSERTFRISARRADKSYPLISPEVERRTGAAVVAATQAPVDLTAPDVEIGVEIQPSRALVYGETVPGPGGLPLGSQGRVVALLSSGIDSPVAAWLMMKRGCSVIPVHFSLGQQQTDQVLSIVEALNRHAYGWQLRPIILSHHDVVGPVVERLQALRQERWACLFCKRALLSRAAEIAREMGASALVTGDSLGQVASQTLNNLEVITYGIPKPILRPLIGMDKTEIMDMARHIGTYEPSIQSAYACPFLPEHPLTQATVDKLIALLAEMEEGNEPQPDGERVGADV